MTSRAQQLKHECFHCCVFIILYLAGFTESQVHIGRLETEVRERSVQVEALNSQLQEMKVEKTQLAERLTSINSLMEASQANKEDKKQVGHDFSLPRVRHVHMPDGANSAPFIMCSNRMMLQNWTSCGSGTCKCIFRAQLKAFHVVNYNSLIPPAFRRGTVS